jgi:ribosomal protein S21
MTMSAGTIARPGETFEELYRRFKRDIETSGILREVKRRQHFIPEHERRRAKVQSALRRRAKVAARGAARAARS